MKGNVFLGVPEGSPKVENPDGVFHGASGQHSLYDNPLRLPIIPGDFDMDCPAPTKVPRTGY